MATLWQGSVAPGLGRSFGEGIQSQVNEGLNYLAQKKLMDLQSSYEAKNREALRNESAQGWESILGQKGAQAISRLPAQIQAQIAQNPSAIALLQALGNQNAQNNQGNIDEGVNALQGYRGRMPEQTPQKQQITPDQLNGMFNPFNPTRKEDIRFGGAPSIPEEERRFGQRKLEQAVEEAPQRQQQTPKNAIDAQKIAEAFTPEATKLKREQVGLSRISTFQPEFNKIKEAGKSSRELKKTTEQALEVFNRRGAKTGFLGKITPSYLQSPDGQVLQSKLQQIVLQRIQRGKGVPHQARLIAEQGSKADIWQHPDAIEEILTDQLNDPEMNREIYADEARNKLQQKYGGEVPNDILTNIESYGEELMSKDKAKRAAKFTKELLPSAKGEKDGTKATNPITGEDQFIVRNGKWENI